MVTDRSLEESGAGHLWASRQPDKGHQLLLLHQPALTCVQLLHYHSVLRRRAVSHNRLYPLLENWIKGTTLNYKQLRPRSGFLTKHPWYSANGDGHQRDGDLTQRMPWCSRFALFIYNSTCQEIISYPFFIRKVISGSLFQLQSSRSLYFQNVNAGSLVPLPLMCLPLLLFS